MPKATTPVRVFDFAEIERDYRPGRIPVEQLDAAVDRYAQAVA